MKVRWKITLLGAISMAISLYNQQQQMSIPVTNKFIYKKKASKPQKALFFSTKVCYNMAGFLLYELKSIDPSMGKFYTEN